MKSFLSAAAAATALFLSSATARSVKHMYNWQSLNHLPGRDWQHVPKMGNATFKQLIDHSNPGLGTFEQFYFYDTTYWKGPGKSTFRIVSREVVAGRLELVVLAMSKMRMLSAEQERPEGGKHGDCGRRTSFLELP